jgi:hypothetical protein
MAVNTQLRCKRTAGKKGRSGRTRDDRTSEPHFERLDKHTLSVPSGLTYTGKGGRGTAEQVRKASCTILARLQNGNDRTCR